MQRAVASRGLDPDRRPRRADGRARRGACLGTTTPAPASPSVAASLRRRRCHRRGHRAHPSSAAPTSPPGDRRARSGSTSARSPAASTSRSSSRIRATAAIGSSSSSRAGASGSSATARSCPQPFLDLADRVSCCGEQGLLGLALAPGFGQTSGAFFVDYTDQNGDTVIGRGTVRLATAPPTPRPATSQTLLHDRPAVPEPQRRHARLRPGRRSVHRHGRRRVGRRPAGQRPEPATRSSARSCASTSRRDRRQGRATSIPPTTRSSSTAGREARDLGLRPAQPLALQLRPVDRRPVDRRRRPGPVGGGRRRPGRRWRRSRHRTTAGTRMEGTHCFHGDPGLRPDGPHAAGRRVRPRVRGLRGRSAATCIAERRSRRLRARTCSATSAAGRSGPSTPAGPPGQTPIVAPREPTGRSARSARTRPVSSTSPTSPPATSSRSSPHHPERPQPQVTGLRGT